MTYTSEISGRLVQVGEVLENHEGRIRKLESSSATVAATAAGVSTATLTTLGAVLEGVTIGAALGPIAVSGIVAAGVTYTVYKAGEAVMGWFSHHLTAPNTP